MEVLVILNSVGVFVGILPLLLLIGDEYLESIKRIGLKETLRRIICGV